MRFGFCLGLAALVLGCNGDDEHAEAGPICTELGEACHEAGESGDAEAEACHDVGHAGDEEACAAERDACLALCESVGGTGA